MARILAPSSRHCSRGPALVALALQPAGATSAHAAVCAVTARSTAYDLRMNRRYVSPALFLLGAGFAVLAAVDLVGFYGGMAAIVCIVLGVAALPMARSK